MSNKKILGMYSKELRKANPPTLDIEGAKEGSNVLEQIRSCEKEGKSFTVTFSYSAANGDLKAVADNNVMLVMTTETLKEDIPYYVPYIKDRYIGVPIEVKVDHIDEDINTVYLRISEARKNKDKAYLLKVIFDELKQKEKDIEDGADPDAFYPSLVVAGRVVEVRRDRLLVDILGKGILGFCRIDHWRKVYTRTFEGLVQKGRVYDFEITRQAPKKKGKDYAFELSAENLSPDPWESLPDEFTQVNSVIMVKCLEKPTAPGKRYWWGRSDLLPDIEIMGDYSNKAGKILQGVTYKCKVYEVDKVKHTFKVVPFEMAETDVDLKKAVEFIQGDKKRRSKRG